ncbi:alkyl/aryl-sulfatase [Lysinibacillus sp. NPDC097287]|uniref:alkyl/aryl-sulfatase n=1 Tax=Lysinibacillus sp. NPDC097287 TaxID=3364144 RepID=UPI0037F49B9A
MSKKSKEFLKKISKVVPLSVAFCLCASSVSTAYATKKPKPIQPKDATSFTKEANASVYNELNFADKQDYEDVHRGFIAPLDPSIKTDKGEVPLDLTRFSRITNGGEAPDTVNPSLWRNSQLQNAGGLYKIRDGVYQVRGLEIANMIIMEGKNGIVVLDTMTYKENAKTALELYFKYRGKKPVTGIVISHSHMDHFGGIAGVMQYAENPNIPIVVPDGFMEEAISENVLLGNIMARRAQYQFGNILPVGSKGMVSNGVAAVGNGFNGVSTILKPTNIIQEDGEKLDIDGLNFEFLMAQDTEAPAEMNAYVSTNKTLWIGEIVNQTLHNVYTLRGTKARDALAWSTAIDKVDNYIQDKEIDVLVGSHNWPTWGKDQVEELVDKQRDLYKYLHDQTIRLANEGYTMDEIAEMIKLPDSLAKYWANRGYYGTVKHNVKAIYNYYLGYYNSNPSDLDPLPQVDTAKKYVEYMGGEKNVMKQAEADYNEGQYRWVAQVLKNVVMANPTNEQAKNLLADAYEQLGYQAESAIWRNEYLTGASELRNGIDRDYYIQHKANTSGITASMPVQDFLNLLSVKLNGMKADKKHTTINLNVSNTDEKFVLTLENSVLHYKVGQVSTDADTTITLDKGTLFGLGAGAITIDQAVGTGKLEIVGSKDKLVELLSLLDTFDPVPNIVTP